MSEPESPFAVLVKSTQGYIEIKDKSHLKHVLVHKGSLLIRLDSLIINEAQGKHGRPVNYKVSDSHDNLQSEAFLFAEEASISCITTTQRDFLLGIKQTHYRMEVLDRLQWVESLTVGSEVYVTIATIPTPVKGIVRYIGGLNGEEGRKFGIEMMERRGEGTQDGEFKGEKYFKCDKDCAVFVAMDKITNYNTAKAAQITKASDTSVPKQLPEDHKIKISDHVFFYDRQNILFRGTAKWIGADKSTNTKVVGIEVEDDLVITNIPHHVKIKEDKEYFSSEKSIIFLPITYVMKDTSRKRDINSGDKDAVGHKEDVHMSATASKANNPHNLIVGSAVQYMDLEQYGVIKWIGTLPGTRDTYAGVEMEDYVDDCIRKDGVWGGVKYFSCEPSKGKFVILNSLKPDRRVKKEVLPGMLLKDSPQKKKNFAVFSKRTRKGELMQKTGSDQWIVAYSEPPVYVDCQNDQVKFINTLYVPYLLAVKNLEIRYNVFTNEQDSLTYSVLLNVGDKVDVMMDQQVIPTSGIVRYKGNLPGKSGIYFGIEIMESDKFGDTDGAFLQERKFSCPANKGLFVSVDKLKRKLSDSFMQEYAKQSACGLAPSRTFKITFVGPEGSGKTSSIRTLLGKKFNPHEASTIGAILGIQAIIKLFKGSTATKVGQSFNMATSHSIGWKETSLKDVQQIRDKEFNKEMALKLASPEHKSESSSHNTEPVAKNNDISTNKEFGNELGSKVVSSNPEDKSGFFISDSCPSEPMVKEKKNDQGTNNLQVLSTVEKEIIRERELDYANEDSEQYSQAKSFVFGDKVDELERHACISDFAGQLTFFSFQLFFLKKHDTVVITFNASLKLTAKIIPRERYDHAKKKRVAAGMMTTIENIEFWLQSVSAHAGTNDIPSGCISLRSPTAILCATHAEKLSAVEMVNITNFIFDHLSGKPYADHLPTDREKAIVFISNKDRRKFADNIIMMQHVVLEAAKPAYSEERPISYLKLEQSIATKVAEGVPMINVEEFTTLVNKAGIPGDKGSEAVNAALQYCSSRGIILYFPEVKLLSEIVFVSPDWLSSIFSKIITTHDQVTSKHSLYHAWKRYDEFAILEEQFLDHVLKLASVSEYKEIIISLMESFNLLVEIPNNTCFANESAQLQADKKIYMVPALLLYNPDLPTFVPEKDQIYLFYFSELYFPESAFNQILVKMIKWSVQKKFQIIRIQHGLGQFSLGNLQSYCLIYEPNDFTLKVCITQLKRNVNKEKQRKAFILFVELMCYLQESINSVIKLYLPSTKPPFLHVFCPKCNTPSPHIMLEQATEISLNLRVLFCRISNPELELPRESYLPFGSELIDDDDEKNNKDEVIESKDVEDNVSNNEATRSIIKSKEEPFYTADDLKKKYNTQKAPKLMLNYGELNTQQKEILSKVQLIIVVVNDNEFMATMCYLAPPDHVNVVLRIHCKTPNSDSQIFHVGNFGKCPTAVTWIKQGCGKDALCYVSLQKEYFKNLVLVASVGFLIGFPISDIQLGDVLISEQIHTIHDQDNTSNPRDSVIPASQFMLNLLKEYFDWEFPCTLDKKRDASVKFGLILNKHMLLSGVAERTQSLHYIGQKPKGIELDSIDITGLLKSFIIVKGVCNFTGDNTKVWEPTAALAANDYLYHHLCQTDLSLLVEDQNHTNTKQLVESKVLQQFYQDLQGGLPIDELLPRIVTKKIITINDKISITESGKNINERCQFFLDHYIAKPLLAGDPTPLYKLLQLMESSFKCILLATKIKHSLKIESLQDKISELSLSGISTQNELPVPELNALSTFYEKICSALPVDELLPNLVKERVITVNNKTRISASGKTEFERSQYLLDYYIARPLSVGDVSFFNKLLDIMSNLSKCNFLVNEIQHQLSTTTKHQKFSGESNKPNINISQEVQSIPPVLGVGSAIQLGDPLQYGVIKRTENDPVLNIEIAEVEMETGEHLKIPLDEIKSDSRLQNSLDTKNSQYASIKLEPGSLIQFGNPVQYGVIRRIELAVDTSVVMAEVETGNKEMKRFPLTELQYENRFLYKIKGRLNPLEKEFYKHDETWLSVPPDDRFHAEKHTGIKGIQECQNSSYLDASIYGLFTFSDAFDFILLEEVATSAEAACLQKTLKSEIVYPLRKKGVIVQESVGRFRENLMKLQNSKGLSAEEKADPEEFLNMMFKHILHLDPFITIRRLSGIDKRFYVQLFVEPDVNPAVSTQELLSKMFQQQNVTFAEYPTRLLLKMPPHTKELKIFQCIIPSLELNVTPLCMTSGLCYVCQHQVGYVCNDCSNQRNQIKFYCTTCSPHWHRNFCNHKHVLDFDTAKLQLLSVLCVKANHYVCFTRIKDEWVFFDSMAEKQDSGYNLPKVTHCTSQLQEFVYGKKDIGNISSENIPELVRQFMEDAYLCIYTNHDGVMRY